MVRKILLATLIVFILVLLFPSEALAARKRPPRGGTSQPVTRTYTRGIRSSVTFRGDRLGLLINFSGYSSSFTSVTYTLTYSSQGVQQGAMGTLTSGTAGEQREVLFGTCSHGVCRYHSGITNAKLTIDTKLRSGITIRKPYRIRI